MGDVFDDLQDVINLHRRATGQQPAPAADDVFAELEAEIKAAMAGAPADLDLDELDVEDEEDEFNDLEELIRDAAAKAEHTGRKKKKPAFLEDEEDEEDEDEEDEEEAETKAEDTPAAGDIAAVVDEVEAARPAEPEVKTPKELFRYAYQRARENGMAIAEATKLATLAVNELRAAQKRANRES